jgi:hypothetical protein
MARRRQEDEMSVRIVAILLSLSYLALRAQCAPFAVHCLIHAAMSRAEAVARCYALGAGVSALAPLRLLRDGAEPLTLACLALRLRMLALTLLVAMWRSCRPDARPMLRPAPATLRPHAACALAVRAKVWPDTS